MFAQTLQQLPVSSLLAAAFMTYLGAEPEDTRQLVLAQWAQQLGLDTTWSFTPFMSSERELLTWKAEGTGDSTGCGLLSSM